MVIDMHTHFSGGRFFNPQPSDVASFLADMDLNGIEKCLLLPLDGFFADWEEDNDRIAEVVRQNPTRFAGLGTVNPRLIDSAVREMQRCVNEKGLAGIKLHPWLQAFSPLEDCCMELAAAANELKTVLFLHDGTPPYTEPFQITEMARRFPDLTVVLGHSGLTDLWQESLVAAKKYENVWLCFCGCPFWGMREIATQLNGERIVWGSDYPLAKQRDTEQRIREVEHLPLSADIIEKILYRNAQNLLSQHSQRSNQAGVGA